MAETIQTKLNEAVNAMEQSYYRLILLVGESGSGKTMAIRLFADQAKVEIINLNLALSESLLGLTKRQREIQLPILLDDLIADRHFPVIFDNIELLFDVTLQNDPLRVLQRISRNHLIIATWNGTFSSGKLNYAAPWHNEFREYDASNIYIISMN